ncbi:hypothetical protein ATCC90586_001902 [Pythium insidiosum]|nr:hypothetical protein ATCC90586_001902 [Pythium insidiosum]
MATAPRGYGRAMVDLLASLGYHEAELRADQLEWLFGLPSMRVQAFLDWLLTSIRPRHSVRRQLSGPRDYEIYCALLRGDVGRGLLAGDALQRAELSCEQDWASQSQRRPLAGGDRDAASLDAMDAANSALELEIAALERKLRVAHERNDRLAKLVQRSTLDADCQRRREQQRSSSASTSSFTKVQSQIQRVDRRRRAQRQRALAAAEISPCVDAILHRLAGSVSTAPSSAGAIVVSSSGRVHTTPALTLETSHSSQQALVSTALSSSSLLATARDSVAGESLLSVLLQREPSQQQWRTFLFHHSVADIEALEQQNLRALKARIPVIAGNANSTGSDCSRANACGEDVSMASPGPKMPRSRLRAQSADDPMASPTATARHSTAPPPSPWLHDSDPAHLDLREQDATLYNKCCVELDRLRRAFVVAERDALMADIQVARYECALRQLTTSRRLQYQQFQLMSREAIWAKKQILAASVEKCRQQLEDVVRREVPSKLEELADLQMTSVLLHSYEQKLWRQEHRFVQLKELLGAFQLQHARLRLVHCLLDAERQQVLRLDAMFQTLVRQLNEVVTASELRVEKYDAIRGMESACGTLFDTYINQHDAVAQSIFQRLEALVSGTETSPSHRQHESQRQPTFDELLFGDSVSSTPLLLPSEVSEAMLSATASKDQTEQRLHDVLETLRMHKRSISVDPSKRMAQERDIARLRHELVDI